MFVPFWLLWPICLPGISHRPTTINRIEKELLLIYPNIVSENKSLIHHPVLLTLQKLDYIKLCTHEILFVVVENLCYCECVKKGSANYEIRHGPMIYFLLV